MVLYESQDRLEALAGAFNDEKDHSDAQPVDAISIGDNSFINIFFICFTFQNLKFCDLGEVWLSCVIGQCQRSISSAAETH